MIVFKHIRWKNLLSTGNVFTEVSLNTHSHTLIVGENGAGKSTILDALLFALYGKPFRKINKPQLINSINNRELVVECEFNINNKSYVVKRGIKPSLFEIYADGTLLNLDSSTHDYQEYLEKHILRINFKSFSQIVVLGSASFVPFMQLSAAHRREVIEDLLDIEIFTVMNTLLKEKISNNLSQIQEIQYKLSNIEDMIVLEKQHIEELKTNDEELIKEKTEMIEHYQTCIDQSKTKINDLQKEINVLLIDIADEKKVEAKSKKIVPIAEQLYSKRNNINEQLLFFNEHVECPTCSQHINQEHREEIVIKLKNKLNEVSKAVSDIDKKINELNERIALIQTTKANIQVKINEQKSEKTQIALWSDIISKLNKEVSQKQTPNNQNVKRLEMLLAEQSTKEKERKHLIEQKSVLSIAGSMMKDTGIKTKIIAQYVPIINKLINKYLAAMDFFVNFELNDSFEETIKSRFRDVFSYSSFSEGEKSRIDLALLFTWRAIAKLRNSASTNLLILDEVFDGSLDAQGSEELLNIIKGLTNESNTFVISHKTDAYLDKFHRVLRFEKSKNFSQMSTL